MMGGNYFTTPAEFLINTLFGLYILTIMLRFLLALVRADFYNPVSQFLVRVTNPPLLALRRFIPAFGKIDTSSLALMIALQMLALALIYALRGAMPGPWTLFVLALQELTRLAINVFLFSIFIQVIISWINPGAYNPVVSLLYSLTEPVLGPCRRLLPPISGLDLSPLLALIGLQLAKFLILPLFTLLIL
ncbi:MAG TPA: YggT family protein [Gammaproteobacteria bacterium]|nr:YggT family protein [Gammaproteobacteria bacterium]